MDYMDYIGIKVVSLYSFSTNQSTFLISLQMESFFGLYPEAGAGETGRRRALENCKNNIRWSTYHLKQVTTWINANYQS